jgi:lipoyl synthase
MSNLPAWLIKRTPKNSNIKKIRGLIGDKVNTVCESAKCPNIGECYSCGTVTFMILGDICTRSCKFCGVKKGKPSLPDPDEPVNVADASRKLDLKYVVITSVTRDDLPDCGADQFSRTICQLRSAIPDIKVEVLIPDLGGNVGHLKKVIDSRPDVLNHNVEMVPRLYGTIRPASDYKRSIDLLKSAKKIDQKTVTKSGFMLGLGETQQEVEILLNELKNIGCDIVTIGQYISPSQNSFKVVEYIKPEKFEEYKNFGHSIGIKKVISGPFVRSSYLAGNY